MTYYSNAGGHGEIIFVQHDFVYVFHRNCQVYDTLGPHNL